MLHYTLKPVPDKDHKQQVDKGINRALFVERRIP